MPIIVPALNAPNNDPYCPGVFHHRARPSDNCDAADIASPVFRPRHSLMNESMTFEFVGRIYFARRRTGMLPRPILRKTMKRASLLNSTQDSLSFHPVLFGHTMPAEHLFEPCTLVYLLLVSRHGPPLSVFANLTSVSCLLTDPALSYICTNVSIWHGSDKFRSSKMICYTAHCHHSRNAFLQIAVGTPVSLGQISYKVGSTDIVGA